MAMEVESLELTIEDVLRLHRGWITKLFVDDKKTEVEIVGLLYEHRLSVTLKQIRKCLREWNLLSSPSTSPAVNFGPELDADSASTPVNTELQIESHSGSDGCKLVNSLSQSHSRSNSRTRLSSLSNQPFPPDSSAYTPSPIAAEFKPEVVDSYKAQPLPSFSQHKRKSSHSSDRQRKDKLKLTCHHGPESHEVEMSLGTLGRQGPSPIEIYASDDQSHERIAIGLERIPAELDVVDLLSIFRKSGQHRGCGASSWMVQKQSRRPRKGKKRDTEGR